MGFCVESESVSQGSGLCGDGVGQGCFLREAGCDVSMGFSGSHGGGDDRLGPEIYECIVNDIQPRSSFEDGYKSAVRFLLLRRRGLAGRLLMFRFFCVGVAAKEYNF
jgi:hypothetical protein